MPPIIIGKVKSVEFLAIHNRNEHSLSPID